MKNYIKLILIILIFCDTTFVRADFEWTRVVDYAGGNRHAAFSFSIGGYGYVGGGRGVVDQNDFWQYDPANNVWTQKADYPGLGRYGMAGFAIGNFGYAGLGWTGSGGPGSQFKDMWQYDPQSDTWTQKNDFGGAPRYSCVGFTIGNKGYIGLGYAPLLKDFWEYDPSNDSWVQKADFPHVRVGAVGFGIGSKGYVGTGYDLTPANYRDFYEFDPVNNTWGAIDDLPEFTRRGAVAFTIGNYGYVGSGYNDTTYLTDFYKLDPSTNHWSTVASVGGVPRYWGCSFVVDNYGYVGSGSYFGLASPIMTSDFWRFSDCDGSPVGMISLPQTSRGISMSVTNNNKTGLILDYDLADEKDAVFQFYNNIGQLVLSLNLAPGTRSMSIPISLGKEIYLYNVIGSDRHLASGKVIVN